MIDLHGRVQLVITHLTKTNRPTYSGARKHESSPEVMVTVCIAAICEAGRMIVSASDTMLSLPDVAADSAIIKGARFYKHWIGMVSGDVSRTEPILSKVGSILNTQDAHPKAQGQQENVVNNVENLKAVFTRVYQEELRKEVENVILGRYGLTLDAFRRDGRNIFGDVAMATLCEKIGQVDLQCEFLVHGFDATNTGRIFTVESPGRIGGDFSRVGWWVIGSGGPIAKTALVFNGYRREDDSTLAVYRVCEAKFRAEAAGGVGRNTVLALLDIARRNYVFLSGAQIDEIRRLVEEGSRVSKEILATLRRLIDSWKWQAL